MDESNIKALYNPFDIENSEKSKEKQKKISVPKLMVINDTVGIWDGQGYWHLIKAFVEAKNYKDGINLSASR